MAATTTKQVTTGTTTGKWVERKKMRRFEVVQLWISRLIIWFFLVVVFFPILSIITASLQKGGVFSSPTLLPSPELFTFQNYVDLIAEGKFLGWVKNTVLLGVAVGTIQVLVTVTAAYAFSRMQFWGRKNGIRTLMLLQMMPSFVSIAAIQYVLFKLGMANLFGMLLVMTGTAAFNVWLMKGYIDGIPRELDEAAKVDGCDDWTVFTRIVLPLSKPMLAVMFLFAFIGVFQEYIMAAAILRNPKMWLLTQGLRSFQANAYSTNWGKFSAAVVLSSVPLSIIWMFAQKWVQHGLTRGAIKG